MGCLLRFGEKTRLSGFVCTSMRIRTDGDYAHREDTIQAAADELGCNKTRAVLKSCDLVGRVLPALEDALTEADIRPSAKEEIAAAVATREISLDVDTGSVSLDVE